jgi:hypothetical protein
MDANVRPYRACIVQTYLQQEAIELLPWPTMSPDMNPVEHLWNYLGRKVNARTPKCQYFRNWGLFWCRNGNSTLNTDWDAWLREWYDAVRLVIDCIMGNKCWKLISFHFPTRLNVLWLCKYFSQKSKLKFVSLNFQFNSAYSLQRAIVLPVTHLWKNTWSLLKVCVILCSSIKGFAMPNCRLVHTFEKNIFITVKNWWSLTYGQVYTMDLLLFT